FLRSTVSGGKSRELELIRAAGDSSGDRVRIVHVRVAARDGGGPGRYPHAAIGGSRGAWRDVVIGAVSFGVRTVLPSCRDRQRCLAIEFCDYLALMAALAYRSGGQGWWRGEGSWADVDYVAAVQRSRGARVWLQDVRRPDAGCPHLRHEGADGKARAAGLRVFDVSARQSKRASGAG
ncbi:MAG: hypothetical protein Q9214_008025, partial [Letrouitia sp. 1 TL-2023]